MAASKSEIDPRWDDPDSYNGDLPPDWDARRKATYRRDDWTCQDCGRKSGPHADGDGVRLHAHHMNPRSQGGSNGLHNLMTLCEPCHDAAHDHDIFGDDWIGDPSPRTGSVLPVKVEMAIVALVSLVTTFIMWVIALELGLEVSGWVAVGVFAVGFAAVFLLTTRRPDLAWNGYSIIGALVGLVLWTEGVGLDEPIAIMSVFMIAVPWMLLSVVLLGDRLGKRK